MRVKAVITYDGSAFYGFQKQTSTPHTVTGHIESLLYALGITSPIVGSGRTDRGVHATGQVIHFDLPPFWHDIEKLQTILNQKLEAIAFRSLHVVEEGFHARFSAKKRCYRYIFQTTPLLVFQRNYLAYYPPFDAHKLKEALVLFEGRHDFSAFHKRGSHPHSTHRTIFHSRYYTYQQNHIITFEANGFLRSQVRMMVEASMHYALGKLPLEALKEQLYEQCSHCKTLAPASGLYLAKIHY